MNKTQGRSYIKMNSDWQNFEKGASVTLNLT